MELERLEYKILMEDGPDTIVLGRVALRELGAAIFTAAMAKYPARNIALHHGTQIIKQHDGEPKPEPAAPIVANLKSWSAHLIRGRKMELLGYVGASDEMAAIKLAIEHYALSDEQRKRLAINPRR
jgi:hypothetical protein